MVVSFRRQALRLSDVSAGGAPRTCSPEFFRAGNGAIKNHGPFQRAASMIDQRWTIHPIQMIHSRLASTN